MAHKVVDRTASDRKAASEGFRFLVVIGKRRIAYTTTMAEAKQVAGARGRILGIADLHLSTAHARNPEEGVDTARITGAKVGAVTKRGARAVGRGLAATGRFFKGAYEGFKSANPKASRIDKMRKILAGHQAATIEKRKIDAWTASTYVQVYDAINAANKARLEELPISSAIAVVYRLAAKSQNPTTVNPATQPVVVYEHDDGEIVNAEIIDYVSDIQAAKKAAQDRGYVVSSAKHGDFGWGDSYVTGYQIHAKRQNPRKRRNPSRSFVVGNPTAAEHKVRGHTRFGYALGMADRGRYLPAIMEAAEAKSDFMDAQENDWAGAAHEIAREAYGKATTRNPSRSFLVGNPDPLIYRDETGREQWGWAPSKWTGKQFYKSLTERGVNATEARKLVAETPKQGRADLLRAIVSKQQTRNPSGARRRKQSIGG